MVLGRVVDVAGIDFLLDPADAVHQAGGAGFDPRAFQLCVAAIGFETAVLRDIHELDREWLIALQIGHLPRFGSVGDIAVGQQHDRRHILRRNPHRLNRAVEAIDRRACSNNRHRRIAIAAIDGLIEVRLFGFGRQAGRWSTALAVHDNQRQFGHDRKAHCFTLQRNARARRTGHTQLARVARANGRTDRGNFIFGLECGDAIFFQAAEMVEDRGGRCDRIAAEKYLQACQLRTRHEPERDRLSTGNGAVEPRRDRRCFDMELLEWPRNLGSFAISMTCVESRDIGIGEHLVLGKFRVQPIDNRLPVAVEHPQRQPERPHIFAPQRILVAHTERLHCFKRQRADVECQHLPFGEAAILNRVGRIFGFIKITLRKLAGIGNNQTALTQRADVGFERRRVHRHQHIRLIACGINRRRTEVDLERRHTEQGAKWRTDFCREIGERRKVVARKCRRQSKLTTGQLHPVATIACKTDNNRLAYYRRARARRFFLECGRHVFQPVFLCIYVA